MNLDELYVVNKYQRVRPSYKIKKGTFIYWFGADYDYSDINNLIFKDYLKGNLWCKKVNSFCVFTKADYRFYKKNV